MSTAVTALIAETERLLYAGSREQLNILGNTIAQGDTQLTLSRAAGHVQEGAYISIDLEIMYVWSVTGTTVQLQRGMLGSTPASHTGGTIIYVNPKFPQFAIFQALNHDLDSLCSTTNGLFQVVDVDLTYNAAIQGYDVTGATNIIQDLRVRAQMPGPDKSWPEIRRWYLKRDADLTDFPSGFGLHLFEGGSPGRTVRFTYAGAFTHFTDLNSTVESTGLPSTAFDLPPLGAAMTLAGVRETSRNFFDSQGDTRRPTEVPPGAQRYGMQALMQLRQQRIKEESQNLSSSYPTRRQG